MDTSKFTLPSAALGLLLLLGLISSFFINVAIGGLMLFLSVIGFGFLGFLFWKDSVANNPFAKPSSTTEAPAQAPAPIEQAPVMSTPEVAMPVETPALSPAPAPVEQTPMMSTPEVVMPMETPAPAPVEQTPMMSTPEVVMPMETPAQTEPTPAPTTEPVMSNPETLAPVATPMETQTPNTLNQSN